MVQYLNKEHFLERGLLYYSLRPYIRTYIRLYIPLTPPSVRIYNTPFYPLFLLIVIFSIKSLVSSVYFKTTHIISLKKVLLCEKNPILNKSFPNTDIAFTAHISHAARVVSILHLLLVTRATCNIREYNLTI